MPSRPQTYAPARRQGEFGTGEADFRYKPPRGPTPRRRQSRSQTDPLQSVELSSLLTAMQRLLSFAKGRYTEVKLRLFGCRLMQSDLSFQLGPWAMRHCHPREYTEYVQDFHSKLQYLPVEIT